MRIGILAIGTELLFGQTVNTNATFLSKELNTRGFDVLYHVTVGDNPNRMKEELSTLMKKVDCVITSGGLGPTEDDITRDLVGDYFKRRLIEHPDALKEIEEYYKKNNRLMPKSNIRQALIPEGSIILPNKYGTAPGFILQEDDQVIVSLPGPPSELVPMFNTYVIPVLEQRLDKHMYYKIIRTFGIGESSLEESLMSIIHGQVDPTIATYAKPGECSVRVASQNTDLQVAKKKVEVTIARIKELVGEYIYSENDEELLDVVFHKLLQDNLTLATAESCTGGYIASSITDIEGASQILLGSLVVYSIQSKIKLLGIDKSLIDKFGVVSPQVAIEMATKTRMLHSTDIGIGTTGYLSGGKDVPEKEAGRVCWAIDFKGEVISGEFYLKRNKKRQAFKHYVMLHIMNALNKKIG